MNQAQVPLAERMRPQTIGEYIGQEHLLKNNAPIQQYLSANYIPSLIFWGPPGVGKTTLALLIAKHLKKPFYTLSAISSGVKDVREIIQKVEQNNLFHQGGAIVFIDEIHRFSKSQQDSLLGAVEKGTITLIGATTENPSFEVISALLSRCQIYTLKHHTVDELNQIIQLAIQKDPVLQQKKITVKEKEALFRISGGDARKLLNLLELVCNMQSQEVIITNDLVLSIAQENLALYDKSGEQHYDIVSAFIKSIRGSDVNASVYWLARMIEGGEDPKFIARRLLICASEDIGLANPNALLIANNCAQAIQTIGWPESRIILSQCTIYLASSPKGNAAYMAINRAQEIVKQTGNLPVPIHLRNAPTKLMKELGYGEEYQYPHDAQGNFIPQNYLPIELNEFHFYQPGSSKKEVEIAEIMKSLWANKY